MNTQTQEALELAKETLIFEHTGVGRPRDIDAVITKIEEALEAEQVREENSRVRQNEVPAQEASEARDKEFVTLTDAEIFDLRKDDYGVPSKYWDDYARAIEQALKDKNDH
jgi:hypothetical protein